MNFESTRAKFNGFAEKFGILLLTLFTLTMLTLKNGAICSYYLLSLLSSIYILLNFKKTSQLIKKIPNAIPLAFLIYPIALLIQFLVTQALFHKGMDTSLLIIFSPLILIFLIQLPQDKMTWPFFASILGIFWCVLLLDFSDANRLTLNYLKPTVFADLMVICSIFSVGLYFLTRNSFIRGLAMLTFIGTFYLCILTETRSSWLALIFVVIYLLCKFFKHNFKSYMILSALLLAFIGLFLINPHISHRINQAIYELKTPVSEVKDTSLGLRKQFQIASLLIIKESYLVGIGHGQFQNKMKEFEKQGIVSPGSALFGHPHNNYLYSFVELGIAGFLGFLAMLLAPLVLFLKHRNDSIYNVRILANIGILLVSCYMLFSLSEVLITFTKQRVAIYFLAIFIPMASILNQKYLHPKLSPRKRF